MVIFSGLRGIIAPSLCRPSSLWLAEGTRHWTADNPRERVRISAARQLAQLLYSRRVCGSRAGGRPNGPRVVGATATSPRASIYTRTWPAPRPESRRPLFCTRVFVRPLRRFAQSRFSTIVTRRCLLAVLPSLELTIIRGTREYLVVNLGASLTTSRRFPSFPKMASSRPLLGQFIASVNAGRRLTDSSGILLFARPNDTNIRRSSSPLFAFGTRAQFATNQLLYVQKHVSLPFRFIYGPARAYI